MKLNSSYVSEKIFTIKINKKGTRGVWYNTRIGEQFDARLTLHPETRLHSYIIANTAAILYVPSKKVIVLSVNGERYIDSHAKKVLVYDTVKDQEIEYESIFKAASALSVSRFSIYRYANKKTKTELLNERYLINFKN